jgi:hypothetical protein
MPPLRQPPQLIRVQSFLCLTQRVAKVEQLVDLVASFPHEKVHEMGATRRPLQQLDGGRKIAIARLSGVGGPGVASSRKLGRSQPVQLIRNGVEVHGYLVCAKVGNSPKHSSLGGDVPSRQAYRTKCARQCPLWRWGTDSLTEPLPVRPSPSCESLNRS